MGTKSSCQGKCFVLLALLSRSCTLFSGRTVGYFSPNRFGNYLGPFLRCVTFAGKSLRTTELGFAYTPSLFT